MIYIHQHPVLLHKGCDQKIIKNKVTNLHQVWTHLLLNTLIS